MRSLVRAGGWGWCVRCLLLVGTVLLTPEPAAAQTYLGATTLQVDVGSQSPVVLLAHGASVTAGQVLFVFDSQPEAMLATAVSGTRVTVTRGYGTPSAAHLIGALVYYGATGSFGTSDQTVGASCTSATTIPSISLRSRLVFDCVGTLWMQTTPTLGGTVLMPTGAVTLNLRNGIRVTDGTAAAPSITFTGDTDTGVFRVSANNVGVTGNGGRYWMFQGATAVPTFQLNDSALSFATGGTDDLYLHRDAANVLALRNGTNAQAFRLTNTWTSSTDFEGVRLDFQSNVAQLYTTKGSGGGSSRPLSFGVGDSIKMSLETTGTFRWGTVATHQDVIDTGTQGIVVIGASQGHLSAIGNGANTDGGIVTGYKTRATDSSANTVAVNGDRMLSLRAHGADGTGYVSSARIEMRVDGTPGTNDMPGRIEFDTTPDGTGVPVTRAVIDQAGTWTLGTGVAAATSATHIIKKVTDIADNTATDVFTVTVPNANHAAAIKVTLLSSNGSTDAFESSRMGEGLVVVARTTGANAVATAATIALTGIATVAAGATHTLAYGVSAISGAVGEANTFTIQVTIDDSGNLGSNQVVARAELINSEATGITIQ